MKALVRAIALLALGSTFLFGVGLIGFGIHENISDAQWRDPLPGEMQVNECGPFSGYLNDGVNRDGQAWGWKTNAKGEWCFYQVPGQPKIRIRFKSDTADRDVTSE